MDHVIIFALLEIHMPIYEYRCNDCESKFSVLNRSFSEIKDPVCGECSSTSVIRIISQDRVITSWNDFMKDLPSWETMTDFDQDDPASAADMMRRIKDLSGTDIGMEGEELTARMDAMDMMTDVD